jgi:hypothetical protein
VKLLNRPLFRRPAPQPNVREEWADTRVDAPADDGVPAPSGWHLSSLDLKGGLEVIEWDLGHDGPPRWWPAAYSVYAQAGHRPPVGAAA